MLVVTIVFIFLVFLIFGIIKAPPDRAVIISGIRKQPRILIDRTGVRIPFLERTDSLYLDQVIVPVSSNTMPTNDLVNVNVEAIIKIRICMDSKAMIDRAMTYFLNKNPEEIIAVIQEPLASNMREIIGRLSLEDLSQTKDKINQIAIDIADRDMHVLGLKIENCNIQSVSVVS